MSVSGSAGPGFDSRPTLTLVSVRPMLDTQYREAWRVVVVTAIRGVNSELTDANEFHEKPNEMNWCIRQK